MPHYKLGFLHASLKILWPGLMLLLTLSLMLEACGGDSPSPTTIAAAKTAPRLVPTSAPGAISTALATANPGPTATVGSQVVPTATVATSVTPPGPTIAPGDGKFSNDLAYAHIKELATNIGSRPAGSDNELKAADYIEGYFRRLGLQTARPEVSFASFEDKGSSLNYQAGTNKIELSGDAVNLSGSGNLTAPLNYIGLGLPGQIMSSGLRGKLALIQRGQLTFAEKVDNAVAAGAVGIIIYNDREGRLNTGTLGKLYSLPVIGLSKSDGERLRQDLDKAGNNPLEVNLKVQTVSSLRKFYNVSGVRPAAVDAPIIIIGGHFDSVPAGPGANDNGSGVGITLELAHLLVNKYSKYELRFVAFSGEEIGLVGSADYVQRMSEAELKRVVAMINIDQVAVGRTLYLGGDQNLTRLAFAAAKDTGAGDVQPLPAALTGASDHASFAQAGVAVLFLNRGDDPNYHQPADTADKVQPELLGIAANTVIKVIDALIKF